MKQLQQSRVHISVHRDYLRVTPLTTDTTPLNYNAIFNDRTSNNSLNSIFIKTQENLNGTKNLTKQDIKAPSHFVNEEIVQALPKTTQQKTSPIYLTLTTPHNKDKIHSSPTTVQSNVKLLVLPKDSHMNHQINRSITKN